MPSVLSFRNLSLLTGLLALTALPALAQPTPALSLASSEADGTHLVGPDGRPVYAMLTKGSGGDDEDPLASCGASCLQDWPLLVTEGEPSFGEGIEAALVDTKPWRGVNVLTYADQPLFQFHRDILGEAPEGQGIFSYGGWWALVRPDGSLVRSSTMPEHGDADEMIEG
ncbi:hypothetical protein ACFSDD_20165 [Salipiger marinus]|jgi:predicted lipoprotein with Yx(FWY)xxD motif|uniref:hypothetical protein n=1 Tax=Salipiger marinus TaxID=555512 RepID=UPI000E8B31A5|nr:hypothetical protein [Salipiger manganoxidans]MCD1618562.1 hypothetical protein [Salipiger manganoxidans]MEB3417711.1 hypothetical protein [Salipiger manganoxidans]HBS98416.1 hypothetical protein [Citreicella sp.]